LNVGLSRSFFLCNEKTDEQDGKCQKGCVSVGVSRRKNGPRSHFPLFHCQGNPSCTNRYDHQDDEPFKQPGPIFPVCFLFFSLFPSRYHSKNVPQTPANPERQRQVDNDGVKVGQGHLRRFLSVTCFL
jgi:hypothetical protein